MNAFYLGDDDRALVAEFLHSVAVRRKNTVAPKVIQALTASPEIYVARPLQRKPIPARTITPSGDEKPGRAECGIYRLKFNKTVNDWIIEEVMLPNGRQKILTVYNTDDKPLEWDFYDLRRDKFGRWLASCCQ